MDVIHNLELSRVKAENEGRIEMARQRLLI
jgi:hypothetical protein